MFNFLAKIFLLSTLLSLAIKYVAPYGNVPAHPGIAGVIIASVPLGMLFVLSWQWFKMSHWGESVN